MVEHQYLLVEFLIRTNWCFLLGLAFFAPGVFLFSIDSTGPAPLSMNELANSLLNIGILIGLGIRL